MSGMRGESGIVHAIHRAVRAKYVGHSRRVLAVDPYPRVEGPHPAKRKEAVERRPGDSQTVRPPRQFLDEARVRRHNGTPDYIAVSIQIFRGRVDDEVRAELNWTLQ